MSKTYSEKLKDPRWQKKRLEIMGRDDFTCRHCGDKTETLNVHHVYYMRGFDPWDYDDCLLFTLCETCHSSTERLNKELVHLACVHARNKIGFSRLADILVLDDHPLRGAVCEVFRILIETKDGEPWSGKALEHRDLLIAEILRVSRNP